MFRNQDHRKYRSGSALPALLLSVLLAALLLSGCAKQNPADSGNAAVPDTETAAETLAAETEKQETEAENASGSGEETAEPPQKSPRKPVDLSGVTDPEIPDGAFTLYVYMVGSDLETFGGAASHDIQEMLAAETGDKVRIVLMTGGAKQWELEVISPESCGIYEISGGKLSQLGDLGQQNMANEGSLESYLRWAGEHTGSAGNALILWNHGGGTMMGYGLDENYPADILTLADIRDALEASGTHFDFIGFDACLMGTVETAETLSPYADYLIASEETEPGSGWFYTEWLEALAEQPDMETEELGRLIVDAYIPEKAPFYDTYTLSLIDLSKISKLVDNITEFFKDERSMLRVDYKSVARARTRTKAFGNGMFEQIDLKDFLESNRTFSTGGNKVINSMKEAVVYSRSTTGHTGGLAIYFPCQIPDKYESVSNMLRGIGFSEDWFGFYNDFLNTLVKGQEQTVASGADTLDGTKALERYHSYSWYHPDTAGATEDTLLDPGALQIALDEEGVPSLHFTEEQRELLVSMMQWYMIFDKNTQSMTGIGYYIWDTPKQEYYRCNPWPWPTVNGSMVTYFELYNDPEYEYGLIPCIMNGKDFVCLLIEFEGAKLEDGAPWNLVGYVHLDAEEISPAVGIRFEMAKKGAIPLKEGDSFQFIRYEMGLMDDELQGGEDGSRYKFFGDPQVYDGNWDIRSKDLLELSGIEPDKGRILTWYIIRDIYQNAHKSGMLHWLRFADGEWYYER